MQKSEEAIRIESLEKRVADLRGKPTEKSNAAKHLDESGFPADLNDPKFVETGEATPPIWQE